MAEVGNSDLLTGNLRLEIAFQLFRGLALMPNIQHKQGHLTNSIIINIISAMHNIMMSSVFQSVKCKMIGSCSGELLFQAGGR